MHEMIEKTITVRGRSRIGEKEAAFFDTVINSYDPVNLSISVCVTDEETYKKNLEQCRKDEDEFRTYVYRLQDEMMLSEEEKTH